MAGRKRQHGGKRTERTGNGKSRRAPPRAARVKHRSRTARIGDVRHDTVALKKKGSMPATGAKPKRRPSRQARAGTAVAPDLDTKVEAVLEPPPRPPGAQQDVAAEPRTAKDLHASKAQTRPRAKPGAAKQTRSSAPHLDAEAFAANLARLTEEAGRAAQA